MKVSRNLIDQIRTESPKLGFKPRPISVQRRLRSTSLQVKKEIEENHSEALLLLEEAVNAVLAYDLYLNQKSPGNAETTPFKLTMACVRADLLSIYQLLLTGQESPALAVSRVLLEKIQILMALAISPSFSSDYFSAEDENAFWEKRIGYGKINPLVEEFIHRGSKDQEFAKEQITRHRQLKTFLSGYIHPTMSSAVRAVFTPVLDKPGLSAFHPLGWFGLNGARLCLYIADEIQTLLVCCINLFIRPDPPPALATHKPDKALAVFFVHAHALQELINKYGHELNSDYDRRSAIWDHAAYGTVDET